MDLSNKSLALLLLAAITFSAGASVLTVHELTQMRDYQLLQTGDSNILGLQTGWAAVNITANVGCEIDTDVNFGTNATGNVLITTNTTNDFGPTTAFNDCTTGTDCIGMVVNNTGNLDAFLNFSSSDDGSTFLGGAAVAADFTYETRNGTADAPVGQQGGCQNITGISSWGAWQNVPTAETRLCWNFTATDSADIVTLEYNVSLDASTPAGVKNATITVTCTQN